ncbi:nucleotide-binding universal stress UspA family protein [Actinoplanes octamycinicus]|uniref:Nucleotide-binding universal stress UspA family protein n=1 Tax=Actinoplanes octamycinicus TaxID=135948 RepID=A0A7W7H2L3_9ACTN|nr:universal stress protein [Actinoplanes octamycinicus]MBB4742763.1 nucleotide-binding universal stress UspA family protein [Actinoplanes octamycinicus]GIE58382.1 universal stress protein [Actinoplanes octamycinicus]
MNTSAGQRILIGYDGSVPAAAAIEVAARLLPVAAVSITHVWTPPFGSEALRHRLWRGTYAVNEFVAAIEREGEAEASRLAAMGATLAVAPGRETTTLVRRTYGGEGLQLAEIAGEIGADLIVVGSRGLGGARAVLGSVSDMTVHYAPCPVLVVPHPLLQAEREALDSGPILVGWDGSPGAAVAAETAAWMFADRRVIPVFVHDGETPDGTPPAGLVTLPDHGMAVEHGRAIGRALTAEARSRQAAMLVVGSLGHSAVREILLGSVTMATLHHAFRPVLVVPHGYATKRAEFLHG